MVRSGEVNSEVNVGRMRDLHSHLVSQVAVNQYVNVNPKNHREPTVLDGTCSELLGDARYTGVAIPNKVGLLGCL